MRKALFAIVAGLVLAAGPAATQPFGIETRAENTTLLIESLPAGPPSANSMQLVRVFSEVSGEPDFEAPNLIIESPDNSGRLFVVEQRGRIRSFLKSDPAGTYTTYLDIVAQVQSPFEGGGGSEEGLLGLAFDPDFATTGQFYVYYTRRTDPRASRISRFTASPPSAATVNAGTEQILMTVDQPFSNHNGGMLLFGPADGMLYIQLGDGGSGGDPGNRAQTMSEALGKILRIDVNGAPDAGLQYRIPTDNPFYNTVGARKEIWALGMRNPWRGCFDPLSGTYFAGDVGQELWEEVDVVERGRNYGWRIREGAHCFNPSTGCQTIGLTDPIAEYSSANGSGNTAITAGWVYAGTVVPELYGQFLYADYNSGRVWALRYNPDTRAVVSGPTQIAQHALGNGLAGSGTDKSGEAYFLDAAHGYAYVVRPQTPNPGGPNPVPERLSDMPALLAAGLGQDQTDAGIIPYEPSAKLWSDGAHKERFLAFPHLDQATYADYGGWGYGEDMVLIKNFLLPLDDRDPDNTLKRIETRILTKQNGAWFGFSYEWNEDETDAQLLVSSKKRPFARIDEDGAPYAYEWFYPARNNCMQCHTAAAGFTLGVTTGQLNYDLEYPESGTTDNQLRTLNHIGILAAPGLPDAPENLPRIPDYSDTTESLRDRARAYLAANCSDCHQPFGGGPAGIDMRWQIADEAMGLIGEYPGRGDLGIDDGLLVAPGDPDRSVLLARMKSLDPASRMPPLATSKVDEEGVQLIADWIATLESAEAGEWMAFY